MRTSGAPGGEARRAARKDAPRGSEDRATRRRRRQDARERGRRHGGHGHGASTAARGSSDPSGFLKVHVGATRQLRRGLSATVWYFSYVQCSRRCWYCTGHGPGTWISPFFLHFCLRAAFSRPSRVEPPTLFRSFRGRGHKSREFCEPPLTDAVSVVTPIKCAPFPSRHDAQTRVSSQRDSRNMLNNGNFGARGGVSNVFVLLRDAPRRHLYHINDSQKPCGLHPRRARPVSSAPITHARVSERHGRTHAK